MALQAALRRWSCSWATKTRQTSLGLSSRGRSTAGRRRSQRKMAASSGAAHTWKGSALAGSLFADDVFGKNLLEVGTADNCERTAGRRMDAVNEALESCGLKHNAGKLVVLPNLRRTVENRRFSRSKQEYQIASWASSTQPCSQWAQRLTSGSGPQTGPGKSSTECGGTRG